MCGIFSYIGDANCKQIIIDGLSALEYRGYDSCGICFKDKESLRIIKKKGGVDVLDSELRKIPSINSTAIIAHTRWATHGEATDSNAHPHTSCNNEVAIVQNGVIENFTELQKNLQSHTFTSNTDTELIAHLIEEKLKQNYSPDEIAKYLFTVLKGSFAIVALFKGNDDVLIMRKDCPLVVGTNKDELYICSDSLAISTFVSEVTVMPNKTFAVISNRLIRYFEQYGNQIALKSERIQKSDYKKTERIYKHYMLQEIIEQKYIFRNSIKSRVTDLENDNVIDISTSSYDILNNLDRVVLYGCGSAWHACLFGSYLIREFVGIPTEVWLSSELRYTKRIKDSKTLYVAVSQSGETLDTLQITRDLKEEGKHVLAITNNPVSQLSRESDFVMLQKAGPEIGVAATKTYTSQLLEITFLALYLARKFKVDTSELLPHVSKLPDAVDKFINSSAQIEAIAKQFLDKKDFMFIGRKFNVATAYEGALKLKEITYLHAEGYAAGEMKHGPLALVDKNLVTFAICPEDGLQDKMKSNISEIKSRNGSIVCLTTDQSVESDYKIIIPPTHEVLYPLISVIPLQLFSYHLANLLGREIDKPRNLAKSVTVE